MILVLALVWGQSVLVTADGKTPSCFIFHEDRKIFPVYLMHGGKEYDLTVLAGADDAALIEQGFELINDVFRDRFNGVGVKEDRNP